MSMYACVYVSMCVYVNVYVGCVYTHTYICRSVGMYEVVCCSICLHNSI